MLRPDAGGSPTSMFLFPFLRKQSREFSQPDHAVRDRYPCLSSEDAKLRDAPHLALRTVVAASVRTASSSRRNTVQGKCANGWKKEKTDSIFRRV